MPTYVTKVRKDTGETVEQMLTVPQESQLGEYLARVDGFVLDCTLHQTQVHEATLRDPNARRPESRGKSSQLRSRPSDLVSFSWYLYTMVHAGVPLARALDIVRAQMEPPEWKTVISDLISSLEKGESFADSMKRFPKFFPSHFVHLVEVGEIAGNLDRVLEELAVYYEKQMENKSRVKGALAYPVLLICACVVVIFFLVTFVLPRIAKMFTNMDVQLPWITEFLLTVSHFLRGNLPWIGAGVVAVGAALIFAKSTPTGRRTADWLALNTPVIGGLYRKFLLARFCQTLALLQRSGVSLLVSLNLARAGLANIVLEDFMNQVEKNLREGSPLGEELARSPYVPDMVSSMISVGEETGQLSSMLDNVSRFYDREIDQIVRTLPKIIEPTIIIMMTGVVGLLAASIFVPLSKLAKGFG